ncbi:serine hydrolase [Edaphobacter bradus]|uniref:serine hydrolase n=1 Tax=Edaphobacter bradus TaxID=2259016 RepID=UPI0021DF875B|nr:serine hydrolase [Edaphobacter bradus]
MGDIFAGRRVVTGVTAFVMLTGLLGAPIAAQAQGVAQQPAIIAGQDSRLEMELKGLAAAHHGHVALYAKQLNTGHTVGIDENTPVQTASVIKLTILFEAMEQVRAGKARWDEKITLAKGDGVNGSGVLAFLDAPQTLTLKDVLTLMVVLSDNTATNLMIDRFGVDAVNARIAWMGLKDTHLYKKIGKPASGPMPADQPKFGLGKTTPREMEMAMERIGRCELGAPGEASQPGDAAICQVALTMLRNQFYRNTIPRYLEKLDASETGSGIASKTGSLNAVRNDVAIVAGKTGPMVISIFTYDNEDKSWTADNEGEVTIGRLAKAIVEAWSPAGLDGKMLVPGLGLEGAPKGEVSASK